MDDKTDPPNSQSDAQPRWMRLSLIAVGIGSVVLMLVLIRG